MGLFNWLSKVSETASSQSIINLDSFDYNYKVRIEKYDTQISSAIKKLASFYREFGVKYDNRDIAQETFVKKVAPRSDAHTCPYCGVVHEFSASRARKCPDCKQQMIVRSGRYLTQEQADKVEALRSAYYDKSFWVDRLKTGIEAIQREQKDYEYAKALIAVAEGFQACAVVHNISHPEDRGLTFWDYSWGALQEATMAAAEMSTGRSQEDWVRNGYLDGMYAKGEHCMRELKYARNDKSKKRYASIAINMFYAFLAQTIKFNDRDNWRREDAIKMIHVAQVLGDISRSEQKELQELVLKNGARQNLASEINEAIREVDDYVFLETKPEALVWMIR